MVFALPSRVKETTVTSGTGTYALAGPVSSFRAFSAGLTNGDTTHYYVEGGSDYEYGYGTYSANTLARTTIFKSSNSNVAVNWAAGTKTIGISEIGPSDLDATNLTRFNSLYFAAGAMVGFKNLLMNSDGRINQRAPATNADDTYGHDRWYALTQTSTIAVSTVSDVANGTPKMWRLTQSQVTAQRMGYAQIIEGINCRHLRGQSVTLSGKIRFSLSAAVRYAICEWIGTEDVVTSDLVNDWTSAIYTAGNFFISATFNMLAVGSITPVAATLTDLTALTATVGSSAANLYVFLWTEGTAAQNATLDGAVQLEPGSVANPREVRPIGVELDLCQRYYKTFTTLPLGYALNATVLYGGGQVLLIPQMRANATVVGSFTASSGAAGTPVFGGGLNFLSTSNGGAAWTANALIQLTATVSAEL